MKSLSVILIVLALAVGSAFATQSNLDTQTPDSSVAIPILGEAACEAPIWVQLPRLNLQVSATSSQYGATGPTQRMGNYQQCWNSYLQCLTDCHFYPEPTRSQCESWCYQTHWCAQV